jgi:hypothetical protein
VWLGILSVERLSDVDKRLLFDPARLVDRIEPSGDLLIPARSRLCAISWPAPVSMTWWERIEPSASLEPAASREQRGRRLGVTWEHELADAGGLWPEQLGLDSCGECDML